MATRCADSRTMRGSNRGPSSPALHAVVLGWRPCEPPSNERGLGQSVRSLLTVCGSCTRFRRARPASAWLGELWLALQQGAQRSAKAALHPMCAALGRCSWRRKLLRRPPGSLSLAVCSRTPAAAQKPVRATCWVATPGSRLGALWKLPS